MQIWIDGDACPVEIKELLYRAAVRVKVKLTLVANQTIRIPRSEFISLLTVPSGLNVADKQIVELLSPGDLVVTADIPLAAHVVQKGGIAIDPRGDVFTEANIGERITMRNLMDELRGSDLVMGGPAPYGPKDKQAFANQLDRILAKRPK
ncbi:MAG: YaiI/YqxD family protein [Planctomycetota bacterium]